jgi:hypothetical protein
LYPPKYLTKNCCTFQSSSSEPDKANPNEKTDSGIDKFGGYIFLDNGQVLKMPQRRQELWPSYEFSKEVALQLQLQVGVSCKTRIVMCINCVWIILNISCIDISRC